VARAVGVGTAVATVNGAGTAVTIAEPSGLAALLKLDVKQGSIGSLGTDHIAVSQARADKNHWRLGSVVRVGFADRSTVDASVGAIYKGSDLVGPVLLPRAMYTPHAVQATDTAVLVDVRNGVPLNDAKVAIERSVRKYGSPAVQDRKEYIASVSSGADLFLGIVYVLLALAIVIALMGIANTLSLAVYERTREVGLLRAVGETRRQVRSMIRWESVIIAVFGTLLGMAVGIGFGAALVSALHDQGITDLVIPFSYLVAYVIIAVIAGMGAAIWPAYRASRLNVLQAISTE
jgi:putative ABC transport system permease protein